MVKTRVDWLLYHVAALTDLHKAVSKWQRPEKLNARLLHSWSVSQLFTSVLTGHGQSEW